MHYLGQIVNVLLYMHNKHRIVHRDIKPGNIRLGESGRVKLVGFGTAAICDDDRLEVRVPAGTFAFWPPELFDVEGTDKYSGAPQDMWALGITLHMLLYGVHPVSC